MNKKTNQKATGNPNQKKESGIRIINKPGRWAKLKKTAKYSILSSLIFVALFFIIAYVSFKILGYDDPSWVFGIFMFIALPLLFLIGNGILVMRSLKSIKYTVLTVLMMIVLMPLLLILTSLILGFIFTSFWASQDHQASITQNPAICDLTGRHMNQCYLRLAAENNDVSLCKKAVKEDDHVCDINDLPCYVYNMHECIINISLKLDNPSFCSEYFTTDVIEHKSGISLCFYRFAKERLDDSICQYTGSNSDSCYNYLAGKLKDSELCKRIGSKETRDSCLSNIARSVKDDLVCLKIESEKERSDCLLNFAVMKNNLRICNNISSLDNRELCIMNVAVTRNDSSICENITIRSLRQTCKTYSETRILAGLEEDLTLCESITMPYLREECEKNRSNIMYEQAVSFGSPDACDSLFSQEYSYYCYYDYAIKEQNPVLCLKACNLSSGDSSDCFSCVDGVMEVVDRSDQCESAYSILNDSGINVNWCYHRFALKHGDITVCDKAGFLKDECIYMVILQNISRREVLCDWAEMNADSIVLKRIEQRGLCS